MAEQFIPIRSVKGYFKEFAVEAIGKQHADKDLVRNQILDAFRKEIFDQITLKFDDPYVLAKDVSEVDPEVIEKVNNILTNSVRKYKRLCILFSNYKETYNVIFPGDLMISLEEVCQHIRDTMNGGETDGGVDNADAEVNEQTGGSDPE